ncbi:MAG TPA: hypothetical protein VGF61_03080 [Candidatus Acidoferrum sp.]|jgi:hypothetical protein
MATATMARDASTRDVAVSYRGLGACWIVYGALRLGIAVWLVGFTRQATVMFGATLVEVAHPENLMAMFHMFYRFAIVLSVVSGVVGLLAGLALLAGQRAGKTLAIIAAFLSLSELPIGITLAVYTLLLLFPRGERLR